MKQIFKWEQNKKEARLPIEPEEMVLEAIRYHSGHLEILDQLQLPQKTHYDAIHTAADAWHAIASMRVRGAPAIALVGALGLAVELANLHTDEKTQDFIHDRLEYLITSRPTAVNLRNAAAKLNSVVSSAPPAEAAQAYTRTAESMLEADRAGNRRMGEHGADWLLHHQTQAGEAPLLNVLTHCNTGSLATAGYGTALGVVRSLHVRGRLRRAYATETRPYNQGARLTAYELVHDEIPGTLVADSMAAALMAREGVAAVVVGADRVAANGDTANKIGTYALAIAARWHGVRFVVAAPWETVDLGIETGRGIRIEERPGSELTCVSGPRVGREGEMVTMRVAAEGVDVWNPAFDVTPAELIDAIVTERGVVEKGAEGEFDMRGFWEMSARDGYGIGGANLSSA